MNPIIHPPVRDSRKSPDSAAAEYRKPNYDCREQADALKLVIYVPGAEAAGVDIEASSPDLLVTARKTRFIRTNWPAAHLEGAQRDYRLRLRLGRGFDYGAVRADIREGVLTVTLPKRTRTLGARPFPALGSALAGAGVPD